MLKNDISNKSTPWEGFKIYGALSVYLQDYRFEYQECGMSGKERSVKNEDAVQ